MAKYLGFAGLLLVLAAVDAAAQQAGGPASGSVSSGVRHMVGMTPFQKAAASSIPISAEPRHKIRHRPSSIAPDHLPAAAPEGSHYTSDLSTTSPTHMPPPILLASFPGISQTSSFPPDPVIAAGPRHLVAAVNSQIHFFGKDGTSLDSVSAAVWSNVLVPGCNPFDPRVLFDHFANRFLMLWHHYSNQPRASYYFLSVSETDDPTGLWTS